MPDRSTTPRNEGSGGWTVFAMYFSAGRSYDYRPAVKAIEAPTLILHGDDDDISLPGSRTYKDGIPNARFVPLSREPPERRAGHFVFDDCPGKFAAAIEAFIVAD